MKNDVHPVFEAAYRQHSDYVFGLAMKFAAGDRSWALDRAHDVFLRLHENLGTLDLTADLRPWLRTVTINECFLDLRRRDRRRRLLALFGFAPEAMPAPQPHDVGLRRDVVLLDHALGRLPPKERMLLGLMYFEGDSLTEAATKLGVSKGQASKLHKKALERLGAEPFQR